MTRKELIASATGDKIFKMAGERRSRAEERGEPGENRRRENGWVQSDFGYLLSESLKHLRETYPKHIKNTIDNEQKGTRRNKGRIETIDTLKRYGITNAGDEAAVEAARKKYSEQAIGYKAAIAAIEKDRARHVTEAAEQIKRETKPGMAVDAAREKAKQDGVAAAVKKAVVIRLKRWIAA